MDVRRLALMLAALLLAAPPASALANDELRVEAVGRDARTLTIPGLGEPDVVARPYAIPGAAGRVPITGYSLDRVLKAARVNPFRFGSLTIEGTSGTVLLTRDEATGRTTFPEGPPVFYSENGEARFLRPARATGEPAELASGGPMTVRIAARDGLSVSATASRRKVKVGQPVRFTATVIGAAAGETVEISWQFDDGRSGAGSEVTHRFRQPGTYDVAVGATATRNEAAADVVSIRVGAAPEGQDGQGGGTNTDGEGGAGTAFGGTPAAPVAPVAPVTPAPPSSPSTGYEAVDDPPQPATTPPSSEQQPNPPDAGGEESNGLDPVEGIELADLAALTGQAGRDAVEAARRDRARDEEGDSDGGVPDGVWWFLATAGLVGLGGLLEVGRRPSRRAA